MKKSPLAQVKEQFGSKEKLVDALLGLPQGILERGEEEKDAFRARLLAAANRKLLRLFQVGTQIEKRFGSKEQLVDGLLKLANRGKDADYRGKLLALSLSKLNDMHASHERRSKRAAKAAA